VPLSAGRRARRHAAIRSLVRRRAVESQSELAAALATAGHDVDQSTLCRDLRELGIAKIDGIYRIPAPRAADAPEGVEGANPVPGASAVARFVTGVLPAGPNLLVVRCATGTASAVGLAIDEEGWPEVVGTLAGDDTLFVATASARDQRKVIERLVRLDARRDGVGAARAADGGRT
jgi:transcriptional regulator of arginine metabolism